MASLSVPSAEVNIQEVTDCLVGDLFDQAASSNFDKVALVYKENQIKHDTTYGALSEKINHLARTMQNCGVVKGDRVGIYFLNHPDFVVSFFAILKVGAVVVPINPLLKYDEIQHILSDSGSKYLVAHEKLLESFTNFSAIQNSLTKTFVLAYGSDYSDKTNSSGEEKLLKVVSSTLGRDEALALPLKNQANASNLAALVYTSGTTGNPKGAILTHSNLINAIYMKRDSFIVDESDCLLAVLPLCHIYGMVVVMMGSLVEGAKLSIMDSFDAKEALLRIQEDSISILPAVPAMHRFISMEMDGTDFDTSSLKYCVTGGAAMDPDLRIKVEKQYGAPVLEGYALTEVCCVATLNPVGGKVKGGSCGPAINGVKLAIFDAQFNQLDPGPENIGQVAIAGPHVMQGYYKKELATKESFHNQFFLTGDLGYLDEDGYLYICGRTKELIIRGGQNIYPKEIESTILSHPKVHDVAVVGIPDKFMGERVKACIVVKEGAELSEAELLQHCKEKLAPYKVPRIFSFLDNLPRNSTGKVLKRLLVD